jgi:uncharacterized cupin superfamily protein
MNMSEKKIVKLTQTSIHNQYYEDKTLGLSIGIYNSNDILKPAFSECGIQFITLTEGSVDISNNHTEKNETVKNGNSFIIPENYSPQLLPNKTFQAFYLCYNPPIKTLLEKPIDNHIIYIDEKSEVTWQKTSDGFKKKLQYQNAKNNLTSGIWQGGNFKTGMITFPYSEFIFLKSGCLFCTDDQGTEHKINAGDVLFIPQGVSCAWRSQEEISIRFVQIQ